ncbi:MAG TPA: IPT/TIG domain-containing protein [Chitinophagaceae bacterium]|nr:IPT/TIG domain-containing protein [Chitinophagaceae bacterium]
MIKLTSSKPVALICVVLSLVIVASCDKDDDVKSDKIELFSFGPTGARHGDTIRFIGNNLNRVTAIEFTGGAAAIVNQADFKHQTSELIKLIVPQAAEKGYVTLKTPEGDIITKTQFNLDVLTTITSMTLQARPGEDITINGTYLNWVDRITFNRDKLVQTFVSKAFNQLVVKVPDDAQTGPLILHYGGTDSADVQTADTLKVTLPLSTSFSPNPVKPGTNVTITGTNLDLTKKVIFNGVSTPVTTFVSQTATQVVVKVPDAAKKGKLTLEAASGVQTISSTDLDIVLPVITMFSPSPINLAGSLTITGTDLDLVKKVIFSGVAPAVTTFTSQSATQIVLNIPAGARDGKIKLEAASGVQTTSSGDLAVILPAVTSFSPNPVTPGTNLTINGTKLDMVTSVAFVNASAVTSFVSQTPSQIVVTVPNGVLRGKITLGVSNPTDTVQSLTTLEIAGAAPPPTIALPIYDDAVTTNWTGTGGWVGGGWGGTANYNNTSPVRAGSKSVKIDYTGQWGSPLQLGAGNVVIGSYTTFKISIFGAPGSAGKKVNIGINGSDAYTITVVEGVWTDYAIPISTLTGASSITEILVKEYTGGTFGSFTIYVDALGLN